MDFNSGLFDGKTVVITGAGRGIGLEVARQFKACGAYVIAHSGRIGTASTIAHIADDVIEADFMNADEVIGFVDKTMSQRSIIDVLINNAGTMVGRFPADEITDEDYHSLIGLNQTSVMQITRGLIPALKKSASSAIVNTVSISAKTGGSPGSSIYSATKAFVSTYTKALARELAPDNIRVNAVSPGTIETDFHERYSSREKLEATKKQVPLKRLGTPRDCAPSYLFLSSAELSGYITGQVLEINGGQLIA